MARTATNRGTAAGQTTKEFPLLLLPIAVAPPPDSLSVGLHCPSCVYGVTSSHPPHPAMTSPLTHIHTPLLPLVCVAMQVHLFPHHTHPHTSPASRNLSHLWSPLPSIPPLPPTHIHTYLPPLIRVAIQCHHRVLHQLKADRAEQVGWGGTGGGTGGTCGGVGGSLVCKARGNKRPRVQARQRWYCRRINC